MNEAMDQLELYEYTGLVSKIDFKKGNYLSLNTSVAKVSRLQKISIPEGKARRDRLNESSADAAIVEHISEPIQETCPP